MRIRSCFNRYIRYILQSGICSLLTFFINSNVLINKFRLQVISTLAFILIMAVDSYFFGLYFGKQKHLKFGIMYPYAMFFLTTYVGHFLIESARWKYLFLPFDLFESFGLSRLLSITLVHVIAVLTALICTYAGRVRFYKNN